MLAVHAVPPPLSPPVLLSCPYAVQIPGHRQPVLQQHQQQQQQQRHGQHQHQNGAGGGAPQLAGWAVRPHGATGAAATTTATGKPKPKPAWGAAGLASDGLTAEERELKEALEVSRQAEEAAAAAAASDEERQLAAALEVSRLAEEERQRKIAQSKVAMEVSGEIRADCCCSAAAAVVKCLRRVFLLSGVWGVCLVLFWLAVWYR